jgi:hypothetical protein
MSMADVTSRCKRMAPVPDLQFDIRTSAPSMNLQNVESPEWNASNGGW